MSYVSYPYSLEFAVDVVSRRSDLQERSGRIISCTGGLTTHSARQMSVLYTTKRMPESAHIMFISLSNGSGLQHKYFFVPFFI